MRHAFSLRHPVLAVALLLFTSARAQTVATGDSRNVTEPAFPAVCQQLSAAIAQVNNDIPASVDATVSNPDGARLQAALNACSANAPGQAVELSMDSTQTYNAFLTGPLSMPPNVTLLVDPGVTVFFSRNVQDYNKTPGANTCGTISNASATSSCLPLIDIPKTSTNVGIMGFGKLNGRGGDPLLNAFATSGYTAPVSYTWWNLANQANSDSGGSQQNPIFIQLESGARNVTLYKITLLNAPMFHVKSVGAASDFTAWDVKIVTPTYTRNTDGIDPDQAQNFTIANSWISAGDDNVAIGASGAPGSANAAENISVINNRFFAGHGESIGSYTDAGVSNVLFDNNMLAGDDFSGHGSAISAAATINTTNYPANYADGNSTAVRIKSDQPAGGLVTAVQYSNSCFLDHRIDIQMTPLYNTSPGSNTPNFNNILLKNLAFLNDAGSAGTLQFTGTNTVVNGQTLTYPLQVTLSNVAFPDTLTLSKFVTTGSAGTEQYTQLTYGPGDVSSNFITDWATFVAVPANHDTATNNITASMLTPPSCNFTYIAPELTGPNGLPQTLTYGQVATAVVILTPAVGGAAYPTGTVNLTDALTGYTTEAKLPGNTDFLFVPLNGLSLGTHSFTAAYAGDTNYVPSGQAAYSTAGPYAITVNPAPQVTLTTVTALAVAPGGGYQATVTVTNNGAPTATNVTLTNATLGAAPGSPLPQSVPTLASGVSAVFTVSFAATAGSPGTGVAARFNGTYTGGSFGSSLRSVTLP